MIGPVNIMKNRGCMQGVGGVFGKRQAVEGGEKGGREKAQPSKKKDREIKRKQAKLDRLQRQIDRS